MKSISILTGLLAAGCALAQAPAQAPSNPAFDKALLPAPANMRAAATIIRWKPDFTYETLRQGTNKIVCFDRSGQPGQQAFAAECTSLANIERVAQNLKFEAMTDPKARQAAMDEAEKNGTRVKPEFGSVWWHVMGADAEHTRTHTTIAVPMATGKSLGLPENGQQGGVWVMSAGTTTAHLMTPGS